MSYNNIDFSTTGRPNKRFTQSLLYRHSKVKGNVLMLCGPAIKEHINDALKVLVGGPTQLTIHELDPEVYISNCKDLQSINIHQTINLKHSCITNALSDGVKYRFIDLDFCMTLDSNLHIVEKAFNYLNNLKGKSGSLNKHILITFSNRNKGGLDDSISKLCKLFNINNSFTKDTLLPKANIYKSDTENALYIPYRDGMPMCSFSYQW